MSGHSSQAPLVAVWSPSSVTVYDPTARQTVEGSSLAALGSKIPSGRDLVVGISQRNTFIRTLPAPNVARVELARIIQLRLVPLLPVGGHEYVSGFRIGGGTHGDARVAIVGAVRADLLKAVHAQAKEAGLNVRAILPFAFASWLLAKERNIADCAVVESFGSSMTIDLVRHGELRYSRAIPVPETDEEFQGELDLTFRIADVDPLPVLAAGGTNVLAEATDPRPLIQQLADIGAIDRWLFSLEPLESTIARESRKRQFIAGRAIAAAAFALVFGAYVALSAHAKLVHNAELSQEYMAQSQKAKDSTDAEAKNYGQVYDSYKVVHDAFHPAQQFSDVIKILGLKCSPESWFTGMTLERGKVLLIRGNAMNLKTVATYVAVLSKNKRFRDVKLVFTHRAMVAKKVVVQFAVSGRVVGNLPLDQVPRDPKGAKHV